MIGLTRINGRRIVVNAELIETVESTPDTVLSLTNGKKLVVVESPDAVVELVIEYRKKAVAPVASPEAARAGSSINR